MRAAIYIRVSTEEQARDQRLSLVVQEQRCRAAALADGAREVLLYSDPGATSRSLDRPAMRRLLEDLSRLDAIYAVDMSRITSSVRDLEAIRDALRASGTDLITLDGVPDITGATGELVSTITVASRRHVLELYRARAIDSLNELARRGHHHGRCPLGYRRPRDAGGHVIRDAPLDVEPGEAELVRRIYQSYARGASLSAIAQRLTAEGTRTSRGRGSWSPQQISGILDNPIYRGLIRYGGQLLQAEHEPLVSEHLWAAVAARRAAERVIHPAARESLSPLLECGLCGGGIHRSACGRNGTRQYRCATYYQRPPAERHASVNRSVLCVESVIWAWTRELLRPEALAAALSQGRAPAGSPVQPMAPPSLDAELADIEDAIAYNVQAARAGGLPPDLLARENAPLLARRDEILRALRGPVASTWTDAQLRWLDQATPELVDRIAALADAGRQRQFLERLYARIIVHREGLTFHHRLPGLPPRGVAYPRWRGGSRGWGPVDLAPWQP